MPISKDEEERVILLSHLLEKLVAVNGFFVTAGYATFFGIWAVVKDDISTNFAVSACLWLLISAGLFVTWHVIGLSMMNLVIAPFAREPEAEGKPRRMRVAVAEMTIKFVQRFAMPWMAAVGLTALIGIGILGTALIDYLVR